MKNNSISFSPKRQTWGLQVHEVLQQEYKTLQDYQNAIISLRCLKEDSSQDAEVQQVEQAISNLSQAAAKFHTTSSTPLQDAAWPLYENILALPAIKVDYFGICVAFINENLILANNSDPIVMAICDCLPFLPPSHLVYNKKPPYEKIFKQFDNIQRKLGEIVAHLGDKVRSSNEQSFVFRFLEPLVYIMNSYTKFQEKWESSNDSEQQQLSIPNAQLTGAGLSFFQIDQEMARELLSLNEKGEQCKHNQLGTHAVCRKENVFYKPNPKGRFFIGPEREFAIYACYQILGVSGVAPALLGKIQHVFFPQSNIPYGRTLQAGLGIDGILLQDLIGFMDLVPFLERCECDSELVFQDLFSSAIVDEFLNSHKYFSSKTTNDIPIEEVAKPIILFFEEFFKDIPSERRFIEFSNLPCTSATTRDIYVNIDLYGASSLIHSLALVTKHPGICINTTGKQNSFTQVTDCVRFAAKAAKLFPDLSCSQIQNEIQNLGKKFDNANFSAHVIVSILTNPLDHKSDNWMVKVNQSEGGHIEKLTLVGIDNDLAFSSSDTTTHSMVYLLPPMQQPLDHTIVQKMREVTAEGFVFDWLVALEEQNQIYHTMQKQGVLTPEDILEDDEICLRIPFTLEPEFTNIMLKKAKKIIKYLSENTKATHQELFENVQNRLAEAYKKSAETYDTYEMKYNRVHSFLEETCKQDTTQEDKISPLEAAIDFFSHISLDELPVSLQVSLIGKALRTFPSLGGRLSFENILHGESFFQEAVRQRFCALVAHILENQKVSVFRRQGSMDAGLNQTRDTTNAAFLLACSQLDTDMAKLLLHYGADSNVVDNYGKSCVMVSISNLNQRPVQVCSFIRALSRATTIPWNKSFGTHKRAALHVVCLTFGDIYVEAHATSICALVEFMVQQGASPDIVDGNGLTALDYAIRQNSVVLIEKLITHGAGRTLQVAPTIQFFQKNSSLNHLYGLLQKQSLLLRWNLALEKLKSLASAEKPSEAHLEGIQFGKLRIPSTLYTALIERGNIKPEIEFGRRNVRKVSLGEYDLFFKQNPEMPGIEYAVDSLFELLIGHGTSFTDLARFSEKKNIFPVLISQGIVGENLHTILQSTEKTELLNTSMDLQSFSEIFLTSLLVNFEDAKPDNFIVEKLPSGACRLIGIDNDHAFVPPLKKKDGSTVLVKCILYCLDIMSQTIHPFAREKFLSFDPEQFLRIWLDRLCEQSQKYNQLFSNKEHLSLSKEKKGREPVIISIPFCKGTIASIFQKFQRLQIVLRESPTLSGLEVLRLVIPELGIRYEEAFLSYKTPLERFLSLTATQYSVAIAGRYDTLINSRQLLKSMKVKIPSKGELTFQGPEIALKELEIIKKETEFSNEKRKAIQNALNQGDCRPFEELFLDTEKEKIITGNSGKFSSVLFADMNVSVERRVLQAIMNGSYRKGVFNGSKLLDGRLVKQFINQSPMLLTLELSQCPNINSDTLDAIADAKYLVNLTIENCTGLQNVVGFPIESLRNLTLITCHALSSIIIPHTLHCLRIHNCWALQSIHAKEIQFARGGIFRTRRLRFSSSEQECILRRLVLEGCSNLSLWGNTYQLWLKKSSTRLLELEMAPLHYEDTKYELLMKSILRTSKDIAPMLLLCLFQEYNISFSECITILAKWKPLAGNDPFQTILEVFRDEIPNVTELECHKWARHVNTTRVQLVSQHCANLRTIDLSSCSKITDDSIVNLSEHCRELRHVNLSDCYKITNHSLKALSNCNELTTLHIRACTRVTDEGIACLTHCAKLLTLDVSDCNMTDDGLRFIGECPSVYRVEMNRCNMITDLGVIQLSSSTPQLEHLYMNKCPQISLCCFETLWSHCPKLKTLCIADCAQLPSETLHYIGKCTNLEELSISGCVSMCEEVQEDLGLLPHCTNLTSLDISHWNFSVGLLIRIARQAPLSTINLHDCDISSEDLTALCMTVNQEKAPTLQLSLSCGLSSEYISLDLPNEIFTKMKSLTIASTQLLDYSWSRDAVLSHLSILDLSYCVNISDVTLEIISKKFPKLQELYVNHCDRISDHGIRCLSFTELQVLELKNCSQITNSSLEYISRNFLKLKALSLHHCHRVTDSGLLDLVSCPLTSLDISGCVKITDNGFNALLRCDGLTWLDVSACVALTGSHLNCTDVLPLTYFNLSNCTSILEQGIVNIASVAKGVQEIHLNDCRVTDNALFQLIKSTSILKELDISNCREISDRGLQDISKHCPHLRSLHIANNSQITNSGMISLAGGCVYLSKLDISGCYKITDDFFLSENAKNLLLCSLKASRCPNITSDGIKAIHSQNMKEIEISYCSNINEIDCLLSFPFLEKVQLTPLEISLETCEKLPQSLESLQLTGNQITDDYINALRSRCASLQQISFENCRTLSHANIKNLGGIKMLQSLKISNSFHCNEVVTTALKQKYLTHLDVSDSFFPILFPKEIGSNRITFLSLRNCPLLTNGSLSIIKKLRRLQSLDVSQCRLLSDSGMNGLQNCSLLERLTMNDCVLLTDRTIKSLIESHAPLQTLGVANCYQISDSSLSDVAMNFPLLKEVNFVGCFVSDMGIRSLTSYCALLTTLNFSDCALITDEGLKAIAGNCPNLLSLNLSMCIQITDDGLTAITAVCTRLMELHLVHCWKITDVSVRSFANCSLRILDVTNCVKLTTNGFLSIKNSLQLEAFTGEHLHTKCFTCPTLRELSLHHCDGDGSNIKDLIHLTKLSLRYRIILLAGEVQILSPKQGLKIRNISYCTKLSVLRIIHAEYEASEMCEVIQRCTNITELSLAYSLVSDDILESIGKYLKKLEILDVSSKSNERENVSQAAWGHLSHCSNLIHINFKSCAALTDLSLKEALRGNTLLEYINLSSCSLITDEGLSVLRNCSRLQHLELYYCNVTKFDFFLPQNLTSLMSLRLRACPMESTSLEGLLKHSPCLKELIIMDMEKSVNAEVIDALKHCPALESLHLSNCGLDDEFTEHLPQSNQCLTSINVHSNNITSNALPVLLSFPLVKLNISKCNNLRIKAKKWTKKLPYLTELHVSDNVSKTSLRSIIPLLPRIRFIDCEGFEKLDKGSSPLIRAYVKYKRERGVFIDSLQS